VLKKYGSGYGRTTRVLAMMLAASISSLAQPATATTELTVAQAVEAALRNYPSIRVTQEQMNSAAAGSRLAQTAYLPRLDGLAQINRATRNNVFGLLLPQSVVPSISGPVLGSNNFGTVWGSAAGVLVTWQPFDFGLRRANVDTATAVRDHAQATVNRTRYDVSVAAADAFLTVIAAQRTAQAAQAAIDSWQVLLKNIHALVSAQLRPGADESRVQAELAAAQTQLAQAEQAIDVARANLAQFVGLSPSQMALQSGKIVAQLPPDTPPTALNAATNPLAMEQNAAVVAAQAQFKALQHTYYPQFFVQGSVSARGTGAEVTGGRLGALNGLAPTTQNYAIGLTVVFPFMDRFSLREQQAARSASIRAGQAQYQVIAANLQAQFNAALAILAGARRVAANTPVEVSSAQTALQQATARYQAGLAPLDDVAQAQRLFVQAQIDDALARLSVWRAALAVETARGDIQPFLAEASQ
jgi:outer membrane protein